MGNNGFVKLNISLDLNELSKSLWELYWQWHLLYPQAENEYDDLSQCMLQMMIVKTRTLEQMLNGVPIRGINWSLMAPISCGYVPSALTNSSKQRKARTLALMRGK